MVYVVGSVAEAEGYFEAVDVDRDEYVLFGDDGTVISPSVVDHRVVLTSTSGEARPESKQG